jgi:hypothetical protein
VDLLSPLPAKMPPILLLVMQRAKRVANFGGFLEEGLEVPNSLGCSTGSLQIAYTVPMGDPYTKPALIDCVVAAWEITATGSTNGKCFCQFR